MTLRIVNVPTTSTILAWAGIATFAGVLAALFLMPLPETNRDPINLCIGALIGWVGSCFAFYFGNSKTGQSQQETLNTIALSGKGKPNVSQAGTVNIDTRAPDGVQRE